MTSKGPFVVEWVSFGGGSRKLFGQEARHKWAKRGEQDLRDGAKVFPPKGARRLFQLLGCSRQFQGTCCHTYFSLALCPPALQPPKYWEWAQGLMFKLNSTQATTTLKAGFTQNSLLSGKSDCTSCSWSCNKAQSLTCSLCSLISRKEKCFYFLLWNGLLLS